MVGVGTPNLKRAFAIWRTKLGLLTVESQMDQSYQELTLERFAACLSKHVKL